MSLANAAVLVDAGIKTAIAAEDALGLGAQEELALSAALAVKGGLDRAVALRAVTLTAAEILGVAARVGSLEPGKDADVVVLSGDPFDYRTRVVRVFIDGRAVRMPEPLRSAAPLAGVSLQDEAAVPEIHVDAVGPEQGIAQKPAV